MNAQPVEGSRLAEFAVCFHAQVSRVTFAGELALQAEVVEVIIVAEQRGRNCGIKGVDDVLPDGFSTLDPVSGLFCCLFVVLQDHVALPVSCCQLAALTPTWRTRGCKHQCTDRCSD